MERIREEDVLRSIMDYLAAKHIFALRMNSGTTLATHNGKTRAIRMHAPGTADILAFPDFTVLSARPPHVACFMPLPTWLEVKSPTGKQSELQRSFQLQVQQEGHRYAVVRSIEDVERILA
jgi:hypothetical protein